MRVRPLPSYMLGTQGFLQLFIMLRMRYAVPEGLTEFPGRRAGVFLEHCIKVTDTAEAEHIRNFRNQCDRMHKHILHLADTALYHILRITNY